MSAHALAHVVKGAGSRVVAPRASRSRVVPALALIALLIGCGREHRRRDAGGDEVAARATGIWDAEFRLERTPRGPVADATPVARGTLALVATRREVGDEWLRRPATHTGVLEVDLGRLGFLPGTGPIPTLVAAVADPDTLLAATPASGDGGILELRGIVSADGEEVVGTWSYSTRAAGGWGGAFTLRRRAAGRQSGSRSPDAGARVALSVGGTSAAGNSSTNAAPPSGRGA